MGAVQYAAAVLADAPKAYWKLQEVSGLPQDSSGNALHMTVTSGTPDYQQSGPLQDFGIQYVGNTENHQRTQISAVVDNFTIELWIKVVSAASNDQECFRNGVNGFRGYDILIDTNGTFQAVANNVALLANSVFVLDAAWRHVVVLRRGGTWEYYVNGGVDTANAGTSTPNAPSGDSTVVSAGTNTYVLAHVAFYETALSSARVNDHYQAALAADSVVGQYVTTMTGKGNAW